MYGQNNYQAEALRVSIESILWLDPPSLSKVTGMIQSRISQACYSECCKLSVRHLSRLLEGLRQPRSLRQSEPSAQRRRALCSSSALRQDRDPDDSHRDAAYRCGNIAKMDELLERHGEATTKLTPSQKPARKPSRRDGQQIRSSGRMGNQHTVYKYSRFKQFPDLSSCIKSCYPSPAIRETWPTSKTVRTALRSARPNTALRKDKNSALQEEPETPIVNQIVLSIAGESRKRL